MSKIISVIPSIVIAMSMLGFSTHANADQACKKVRISVVNQFEYGAGPMEIKVYKINYYDREDRKWRKNRLNKIAGVGNSRMTLQNNWQAGLPFTETLEFVGNEKIPAMQVQFKYRFPTGNRLSEPLWSNVTRFSANNGECVKGKSYTITVTGTAERANRPL